METTNTQAAGQEESQNKRINVGPIERKASLVGGAALAVSGLKYLAKKHYLPGLVMMTAGGLFLYRGKTGHCNLYEAIGVDTAESEDSSLRIEKILTINRPPQQVYEFWHDLQNLPRFMQHLDSVHETGEKTSHWKARGSVGVTVEWDAEMIDDYPGQQISWLSVGETELPNSGIVEFKKAPGDLGTELKVVIEYYPPGGTIGKTIAKLAGYLNAQMLEEDLKRLKQILETGEVATSGVKDN